MKQWWRHALTFKFKYLSVQELIAYEPGFNQQYNETITGFQIQLGNGLHMKAIIRPLKSNYLISLDSVYLIFWHSSSVIDGAPDVECQALLSEIQLMKQLDSHPHVVQMLACCTQGDTVAMVMDFFSNGNLRDFLVKSHNGLEVTANFWQSSLYK